MSGPKRITDARHEFTPSRVDYEREEYVSDELHTLKNVRTAMKNVLELLNALRALAQEPPDKYSFYELWEIEGRKLDRIRVRNEWLNVLNDLTSTVSIMKHQQHVLEELYQAQDVHASKTP